MRRSGVPVVLTALLALALLGSSGATLALAPSGPAATLAPGGPVQGEPPTVGVMPTASGAPMPDFIPVAAREGDGIAGYIATRDMPTDGSSPWWYQEPPVPVYASDLHTLVGFMFASKGFVPLGVDPNDVPDVAVVAGTVPTGFKDMPGLLPPSVTGPSVTLYVRSAAPVMTWFTVLPTPDPPQSLGFDSATGIGVACLAFPAGSHLALMDRTPSDTDAREIRVIVAPRDPAVTTPAWVDVAADGTVTSGDGGPPWWPEGQEPCRL